MERRTQYKTFTHLQANRRVPSDYEIATTKLLYYPDLGFEVRTPITEWYERYQKKGLFDCTDWEKFSDPTSTTYTRYVNGKEKQEKFVDGLLEGITVQYEDTLSLRWLQELYECVGVLRFPYHGLQMTAAYLGSMAPSGKITAALLFQTGDEMRKVQRFAYRLALGRKRLPKVAERGQEAWQNDIRWQPLRRLVENLLVTYDFSEAFVALNVCVKPKLDEAFLAHLGDHAYKAQDYLFKEVLKSLYADSLWQQEWTAELVSLIEAESERNRDLIVAWRNKWDPKIDAALAPVMQGLE